MKSIFEPETYEETLQRLKTLQADSIAEWGVMSVGQAVKHMQGPIDQASGRLVINVPFFFSLIGPYYGQKYIKGADFENGAPTVPQYIVVNEPDFEKERILLIEKLTGLVDAGTARLERLRHPLFGNLTTQEWGHLQWKHLDHHLRQFGVQAKVLQQS